MATVTDNRGRNGQPFTRSQGKCARCGKTGEMRARSLDAACYEAARVNGTLADYSRQRRQYADLIEDYEFLRAEGENEEQIAGRLGYASVESLRRTLARGRRAVAVNR